MVKVNLLKSVVAGGKVIQRYDDIPEAISKRLQIYHEQTEPILSYYRPRGIVHAVDGSKSIDEVFEDICKILDLGS